MPDEILVLVAEDEELVRFLIAEALRDEGIEVMEVGHAQAALDSLEQHAARIHVLFTDIQMPGPMDGLALAHHTSKNWPWIGPGTGDGPAKIGEHSLPSSEDLAVFSNDARIIPIEHNGGIEPGDARRSCVTLWAAALKID
jgi:CheY-like chemotaxis protein